MKKIVFALMAMMAIVMTSCKHETCTLEVRNYSPKSVIVLFSHDEKCNSIEEAEIAVHCKSMNYWDKQGVKVNDMHAIIYKCVNEEKDSQSSLEAFERIVSFDLNRNVGAAIVTIKIDGEGRPGVEDVTF